MQQCRWCGSVQLSGRNSCLHKSGGCHFCTYKLPLHFTLIVWMSYDSVLVLKRVKISLTHNFPTCQSFIDPSPLPVNLRGLAGCRKLFTSSRDFSISSHLERKGLFCTPKLACLVDHTLISPKRQQILLSACCVKGWDSPSHFVQSLQSQEQLPFVFATGPARMKWKENIYTC